MSKRNSSDKTVWIPGMAGKQLPVVEDALKRFHLHATRQRTELLQNDIDTVTLENNKLKLQLTLARTSLWFYAAGNTDEGTSAKTALGAMTMHISGLRG